MRPYRLAVTAGPKHPDKSSVRVSSTSYRVRVIAEERLDVAFDGVADEAHDGQCTTIDSVTSALTVRVPEGTDLVIGSGSGRVDVSGDVGDVAALTDSGRIKIEQARSVDARTRSARIEIGRSVGECRVRSESGRVQVDACCGADVATNSGPNHTQTSRRAGARALCERPHRRPRWLRPTMLKPRPCPDGSASRYRLACRPGSRRTRRDRPRLPPDVTAP